MAGRCRNLARGLVAAARRAPGLASVIVGLGLGLAPGLAGCRGDGEEGRAVPPAATATDARSAPPDRVRPPPPGAVRPPHDFNRPPPVLPRYRVELDRSGRQVTYEIGADGAGRPVGEARTSDGGVPPGE
jgi:hypothetical protein